jgi:pimeloyl-ACP methyl ester carboxylesterase
MFKKIAMSLTVLCLIWLTGSYYLYTQAQDKIFFTTNSHVAIPNFGYEISFMRNKEGENISMWYFDNKASTNTILYLHGNAGRLTNQLSELTKRANVLSPSYPGYGESEGSPTVANSYEAAEIAYTSLINRGVAEDTITILGHSLGGSVATHLAANHPKAKKLILINTFSSVQSMCYKQYAIFCVFGGEIFNSAKEAVKVTLPVREFSYTKDQIIPFEEGQKLYEYFTATQDKKFIQMEKSTHSYPDWDSINNEL